MTWRSKATAVSAAQTLLKPRSKIEVYNDLDGDVVNFFRVIRECPDDLIRAIYWTPFAHAEQQLSMEPTDDPLEAARRFCTWSHLTISIQRRSGIPWRRQKKVSRGCSGRSDMKPAARSFMEVDHLYEIAEWLRGVIIEQMDALELIRKIRPRPGALLRRSAFTWEIPAPATSEGVSLRDDRRRPP